MAIRLSNRLLYLLGILVIVVGLGVDAWFAFTYLGRLAGSMQQVTVPGAWQLTLPEAGTYTVFHERQAEVRGKKYDVPAVPGLNVEMSTPDGRIKIPVARPAAETTYSLDGRSAVSLVEFTVNQPGVYLLTARYPTGRGPEAVLAVGRYTEWWTWVRSRVIGTAAGALVAGLALIAAGVVMGRRRASVVEPAAPLDEVEEEEEEYADEAAEKRPGGLAGLLSRFRRRGA